MGLHVRRRKDLRTQKGEIGTMKDQAQVVIVGGGIVGAQVAYHLAKLGWTDVVLFEKGEIASGESSHAAGLVTQFATSQTLMQFRKYSIELYSSLGLFDHVGSLRVASSPGSVQGAAAQRQPRQGHRHGCGDHLAAGSPEDHAAAQRGEPVWRHLPAARRAPGSVHAPPPAWSALPRRWA